MKTRAEGYILHLVIVFDLSEAKQTVGHKYEPRSDDTYTIEEDDSRFS